MDSKKVKESPVKEKEEDEGEKTEEEERAAEDAEEKKVAGSICATYNTKRYAKDSEYKKKIDEGIKKMMGFIDDNIKSSGSYNKVFQRTPDVQDLSKLLPAVNRDGVDSYSEVKRDFSVILNKEAKQAPITKSIDIKPKPSGLGAGTIEKFQDYLEEVYVKIALNDSRIRILLAQYEQIDAYFFSVISEMDESINKGKVHTASSHEPDTLKFLESIGMKKYLPLGNAAPSYENTLTLFETLDEIKSDIKLYNHILKENGKKYE